MENINDTILDLTDMRTIHEDFIDCRVFNTIGQGKLLYNVKNIHTGDNEKYETEYFEVVCGSIENDIIYKLTENFIGVIYKFKLMQTYYEQISMYKYILKNMIIVENDMDLLKLINTSKKLSEYELIEVFLKYISKNDDEINKIIGFHIDEMLYYNMYYDCMCSCYYYDIENLCDFWKNKLELPNNHEQRMISIMEMTNYKKTIYQVDTLAYEQNLFHNRLVYEK